jgi:diketogulonate reductase-like aldo/keto reductase
MDSSRTFKLADSTHAIPAVGFGCWKVAKDLAPSVVEAAIKNGYRHIDCAADYGKKKVLEIIVEA